MAWLLLVLAGLFEVGFTTCLRYTDGMRNLGWNAGFLVCAVLSFGLLEHAAKTIPLGTAYAVWVGIGAIGTVLVGVATGAETLTVVRVALLVGLVLCIVGLKLAGGD
ncbi:multidrug efflux SMR transporter [Sphingomonas sp.]|uniref:DMT family transporter n=1 Tax=Sphingomonas sp. TaxID=28214 RepID=UPI001D30AF2E|nr:multidrug efflux SMR transporter [Sphingomonas sp.]MBX9797658.1 multidrug efflux SMR transporter [Sphingomonas sp.]